MTVIQRITLVLVDAVKNPEMEDQIARFVEQKFNVNVDDVLIRPLGHAFSAQLHVVLDQNLNLKEAHEILTKITLLYQKSLEQKKRQ
jgi:divalent metal cation (Fe/Co/Zn/Cd) transporter